MTYRKILFEIFHPESLFVVGSHSSFPIWNMNPTARGDVPRRERQMGEGYVNVEQPNQWIAVIY